MGEGLISKSDCLKTLGKYTVSNRIIGRSSIGETYLGYENTIENKFAFKYIRDDLWDESTKNKLRTNFKLFQKCEHENIVKVFDYFQTKNGIWLVIEYCEKGPLLDYLRGLSADIAQELNIKFFTEIISVFQYFYKQNIPHGRLTKNTFLVNSKGELKVANFLLSSLFTEIHLFRQHNFPSAYSPPRNQFECLDFDSYIHSFKCDIFSVGVFMFQMFFRTHPYMVNGFPKRISDYIRELELIKSRK